MDAKTGKTEVYEAEDGWRWRAVAANGEIVASGESYTRRNDAQDAADRFGPEFGGNGEAPDPDPPPPE